MAVQGGDIGGDHVPDMDEIAPLLAVAVNLQHLALGMAAQKYSQHQCIGAGFRLARPIDIEIAKDRAGQTESFVEQQAILFAHPLGQAVDVEKVGRIAFAMRWGAAAVIGGRTAIDETLHAGVTRRQQHVLGAGIEVLLRRSRA